VKTKNKHGRKGVKRRRPGIAMRRGGPIANSADYRNHPSYDLGYNRGYHEAMLACDLGWTMFLEELQGKRNAKDIKGLISRKLEQIRSGALYD